MKTLIEKQIESYKGLCKHLEGAIKDNATLYVENHKVMLSTLLLVIIDIERCISDYEESI